MSPAEKGYSTKATPEQILYAQVLEIGMYLGLLILFLTFALYIFGWVNPHVPLEELPRCWSLSVHDYLQATGIQPGWSWLGKLGRSDFLNFIGIALLSGVTIICYLAIIPTLLKQKDKVYALLALLEALILGLAASGILAAGH
ncbi:MAG: DUF1634 domain-containing protein [Thermodesulfobacteriota bacterium]